MPAEASYIAIYTTICCILKREKINEVADDHLFTLHELSSALCPRHPGFSQLHGNHLRIRLIIHPNPTAGAVYAADETLIPNSHSPTSMSPTETRACQLQRSFQASWKCEKVPCENTFKWDMYRLSKFTSESCELTLSSHGYDYKFALTNLCSFLTPRNIYRTYS